MDPLRGEVDVAPAQREQLALAQPGHGSGEVEGAVLLVVRCAHQSGDLLAIEGVELAGVADAGPVDELAQHAAGAIAKHTRRGWRIDRPNPRVEIDGITALMMAVDRLHNRPQPVQVLGWL